MSEDGAAARPHDSPLQTGASSAPGAEGGKWSCEACTYENFPLSRKCTMCLSARPLLGSDILRVADDAADVAERLRPLRISDSTPQPAHALHPDTQHTNKWTCPTCTYENWPKSLKCAMCGAGSGAPGDGPARDAEPEPEAEPRPPRTRRRTNSPDLAWLQACLGVVEGDPRPVQQYLSSGGDPARALTAAEVAILNRASAFDAGHTLVHLAIRFRRQEILATLLARISGGGSGLKRSPSYAAPEVADAIRRHVSAAIRHKKGSFPARYVSEWATFSLPAELRSLPARARDALLAELLDREAQVSLEREPPLRGWGGARLHALWNRSAGDCLPDAVCQAAYGVADRGNALRRAMHDTLLAAQRPLFERWAAWERLQAGALPYAPEESQLRAEWSRLLASAQRPGAPLRQLHVFVLAHVMRRPLLVYGVDVVTSHRGEPLGYARFRGIYLPLLWEAELCCAAPLCLGYTRGHFSALVGVEGEDARVPIHDLPLHFTTPGEAREGDALLRRWLSPTPGPGGGPPCARLAAARAPLVQEMCDLWLQHYRRLPADPDASPDDDTH